MTGLLLFLSFFPASAMLIRIEDADALMWYLGAYAGLAANNRWAERKNGVASGELATGDENSGRGAGSGAGSSDK